MQWFAPAVSLLGAVVSGYCALLAWSLNRRGQRAQAHEQINQRYDRLMAFRGSHPEVLALAFRWEPQNFTRIYTQQNDEDRAWALYYTYVELVLGFCNAVAYASSRGLLDRTGYLNHYQPLMKLLLTEHRPILECMLRNSQFVSKFVQEFWRELEADGWQWEREHVKLRDGWLPNKTPAM